jgi:hypothetical protein
MLGREVRREALNIQLLCLEQMQMIDCRSSWQHSTMNKYGTYRRFMESFATHYYGVAVPRPAGVVQPPDTAGIVIHWAQLSYSLRCTPKGERVKYEMICQLQSAANMYYMVDAQLIRPDQAMKFNQRVHFYPYALPPDKTMVVFATKGMELRLGSTSKPSWALPYIHIKWLNDSLEGHLLTKYLTRAMDMM